MSLQKQIKPISYFKANASEVIRELRETGQPLIITQNGEATAVVQDIASYERMQETIALQKIVAQGRAEYHAGKTHTFDEIREHLAKQRGEEE